MTENQEMFENRSFDEEIDILLGQNGAGKAIKMLKLIFDSYYAIKKSKNGHKHFSDLR